MSTVTTTDGKSESITEELPDHSDLWEIKKFKEEDFWFMKVGQLSYFLLFGIDPRVCLSILNAFDLSCFFRRGRRHLNG